RAVQIALDYIGKEIEKARREYSKQVAARRLSEYSSLVETAVDAARELGDAILAMHGFADEMRLIGAEHRDFKIMYSLQNFGDLAEPFSPLKALITEAVEKGHVGGGKLPAWKLPAPLELLHI
ncbi:hypothetical protein, partial [Bradyrhizobium sp. C9]|uniref:hypothetical protein n=1 Tax=Bradyrhizobium sp. C9 TaxID=142585 RepID=UPI000BECC469